MFTVTELEFERIVAEAIDALPEKTLQALDNVVITTADCPDELQRKKAGLEPIVHIGSCENGPLLFGLYEGIPKTERNGNYVSLPDKITIFRRPIQVVSHSLDGLKEQVMDTVWHEVAHHFGLGHPDIDAIERRR